MLKPKKTPLYEELRGIYGTVLLRIYDDELRNILIPFTEEYDKLDKCISVIKGVINK